MHKLLIKTTIITAILLFTQSCAHHDHYHDDGLPDREHRHDRDMDGEEDGKPGMSGRGGDGGDGGSIDGLKGGEGGKGGDGY